MIIKALRDEPLPVYGDGMNVRDWIHVQDHCAGVVAALFEENQAPFTISAAATKWRTSIW